MVKEKWLSYPIKGNALVNVKEKLKSLKGDLKIWNKEVFGNVYTRKKEILHEIEELDCMDCLNDLNEGDRLKRVALVNRLKENDKKIESLIC